MATSDDATESGRPNDHEALQEARKQAREAKRQLRRELIHQADADEETKLRAAEVALDYRDLLIDYRQDLGKEKWDEAGVDWPTELVGEQISRRRDNPGLNRGNETASVPAFVAVDGEEFYQLLKNLDVIWRALGFGAEINDDELDTYEVGDV